MAKVTVSVALDIEDMAALNLAAQASEVKFADLVTELLQVRAAEYRASTPQFKAMVAEREARQREERERQTHEIDEGEFEE